MIRHWIIILNYNATSHCLRLVDALKDRGDYGLCVVDNRSDANEYRSLEQACLGLGGYVGELDSRADHAALASAINSGQGLLLLRAAANLGYAGGNNLAMRALLEIVGAGAQFLIVNPDIIITPDAATALLQCDAAICGPAVFEHYRQGISTDGQRVDFSTGFAAEDDTMVNCLSGCCLKLSGRALQDYGLLPENNFLYDEEVRYFERVHRQGGVPRYLDTVRVEHLGSSTVGKHGFHYFYYIFRNRLRYYFEIAGPRYRQPLRFLRLYTGWYLPVLYRAIRRGNWPGVHGLLLGAWHGIRRVDGPYRH